MFSMFGGIFKFFAVLLGIILSPFALLGLYLFITVLGQYYYQVKVKKYPIIKVNKDYIPEVKKQSFLKRLLIDFPRRLVKDMLTRDPYEFKETGIILFCGPQGSGKTIAMCEYLQRLKRKYPKALIHANLNLTFKDGNIKGIKDILNVNNGKYGVIKVLDEIQTELSCKDSGNVPYELLAELCQQRKQRSLIAGTAQVFSRVTKELREQVSYVYVPRTIFNCLTIVKRSRPDFYDMEKQKFTRYDKTYFFVHTDELRNCYDTYQKIERYKKSGFIPRNEELKIDNSFFTKS